MQSPNLSLNNLSKATVKKQWNAPEEAMSRKGLYRKFLMKRNYFGLLQYKNNILLLLIEYNLTTYVNGIHLVILLHKNFILNITIWKTRMKMFIRSTSLQMTTFWSQEFKFLLGIGLSKFVIFYIKFLGCKLFNLIFKVVCFNVSTAF